MLLVGSWAWFQLFQLNEADMSTLTDFCECYKIDVCLMVSQIHVLNSQSVGFICCTKTCDNENSSIHSRKSDHLPRCNDNHFGPLEICPFLSPYIKIPDPNRLQSQSHFKTFFWECMSSDPPTLRIRKHTHWPFGGPVSHGNFCSKVGISDEVIIPPKLECNI